MNQCGEDAEKPEEEHWLANDYHSLRLDEKTVNFWCLTTPCQGPGKLLHTGWRIGSPLPGLGTTGESPHHQPCQVRRTARGSIQVYLTKLEARKWIFSNNLSAKLTLFKKISKNQCIFHAFCPIPGLMSSQVIFLCALSVTSACNRLVGCLVWPGLDVLYPHTVYLSTIVPLDRHCLDCSQGAGGLYRVLYVFSSLICSPSHIISHGTD